MVMALWVDTVSVYIGCQVKGKPLNVLHVHYLEL